MLERSGDTYRPNMNRTGTFVPRTVEKLFKIPSRHRRPLTVTRVLLLFLVLLVLIVGGGFALRSYTIHHLPLQQLDGVDALTITQNDPTLLDLFPAVVQDSLVAARLRPFLDSSGHRLLAYFIPFDYVMQGMIANTGDEWKLFAQHKTIGMISDYILHPSADLTGGHSHHLDLSQVKHGPAMYDMPMMKRRVIFIDVSSDAEKLTSPYDDFDIHNRRTPLFFVDAHLHTAEILQVKDTPPGSGWGTVPTPMF